MFYYSFKIYIILVINRLLLGHIWQLILEKIEIPINFKLIFRHDDSIQPPNIKTDADREWTEHFEYVISFSVAFGHFEIFYSKVNLILSIFTDFLVIFGIIGTPGFSRFSSNDCQSCQLILSNRICSHKFLKWIEHH